MCVYRGHRFDAEAPKNWPKWKLIIMQMTSGVCSPNLQAAIIVQAFYHEKSVNLPLIAKEGFLTVFGSGTCLL